MKKTIRLGSFLLAFLLLVCTPAGDGVGSVNIL